MAPVYEISKEVYIRSKKTKEYIDYNPGSEYEPDLYICALVDEEPTNKITMTTRSSTSSIKQYYTFTANNYSFSNVGYSVVFYEISEEPDDNNMQQLWILEDCGEKGIIIRSAVKEHLVLMDSDLENCIHCADFNSMRGTEMEDYLYWDIY